MSRGIGFPKRRSIKVGDPVQGAGQRRDTGVFSRLWKLVRPSDSVSDAIGAVLPQALEWKEHPMPQTVDLAYLSIAEAGALFRRREISPVELVNALLERSERLQETLVSYVTLTPELARQQARTAESAVLRG